MKFDGLLRVYRWKSEEAKAGWKKSASDFSVLVKISDAVMSLDVLVCEVDQHDKRRHVMRIDGIDYNRGVSIFTTQDIEDFLVELTRSQMEKYV